MKLLMFDTEYFWYETFRKNLEQADDAENEERIEDTAVVFIHSEAEDENRRNKVLKSAVSNLKWYLNKVGKERIVLHSFAHLSSSNSSPEFAMEIITDIKEKLASKGIDVRTTPFGYFSEFSIHVRGESLAKVFKEI
ncbi:threonyl-tRNA synthetase editing domain-containing protein [Methanolobus sediminis]|uniref:Threonyl-tRNA synthetase editing domain-containing protein n=1 Tax=Methanolobus sediminis TaxID=3072978 RepID=A0AA51YM72_9EURY|nr:threonyl-tRNA synthetase editing domain-containing protein [Methanolobus sediminis]WMW25288.1 threonyl-tRNA synthetase editing domain-containing protein [Methanolobus sediminis]